MQEADMLANWIFLLGYILVHLMMVAFALAYGMMRINREIDELRKQK